MGIESKMNCVYGYFNILDNSCLYIGKSNLLTRRDKEHKYLSKASTPFEKKCKEFGWEKIELKILEENILPELLRTKEREYWNKYKPLWNTRCPLRSPEERIWLQLEWFQKQYDKLEFDCLCAIKI